MHRIPVVKVELVREKNIMVEYKQITSAEDVAKLLFSYLDRSDREHFVVLLLDTKHRILGINTVSIGILDASIVHPREVYKPAILTGANAIIVGHNHPSGDPTPSLEDVNVTKRLKEAGRIIGIELLDHIVVGSDSYVSLVERGLM